MQNFGVANKAHYGMLWYFLEWSIQRFVERSISEAGGVGVGWGLVDFRKDIHVHCISWMCI